MNYFSKNLKYFREKKKLNQQEIADDLDIPRPTYTCWETGIRTPKIEQIIDIAEYFGVGMDIVSKDYSIEQNSFANRLNEAIIKNNYKINELSEKTGIDESFINDCLNGKIKPNSMNIQRFAATLNVSENWLKGNDEDEVEILYKKYKEILTDSDKTLIKTIIEQRIKENNNGNIPNN